MRKPAFCICQNKDADQLHCNHAADQSLSFGYIHSTVSLLTKSEIQASSHFLCNSVPFAMVYALTYFKIIIFGVPL